MKRHITHLFRAMWCTLYVVCTCGPSWATDGYFAFGTGIRYKSMAGAGVGLSLGKLAAATNPAAMAFAGSGYELNLGLFAPNRGYTVMGQPSFIPGTFGLAEGTVESNRNLFLIPALGANWMWGENKSLGIVVYGNGGMNTTYDHPVFGYQTTGIDMLQLFVAPTFSIELREAHALGMSVVWAYQQFEANGLLAFSELSESPQQVSNNGVDVSSGFGLRVGYQGRLTHFLSIGLSAQTRIAMSSFDQYAGLFAEGGRFDIPFNWTAGLALHLGKIGLALDYRQIAYGSIAAIANPLLPHMRMYAMGSANGPGFGWQDMNVWKLGLWYDLDDRTTLRAGFSTGRQPIPESEVLLNILAPAVIERHLTIGFSTQIDEHRGFSLFVARALPARVQGPNPLEMPGRQQIELFMDQWEIGIGLDF